MQAVAAFPVHVALDADQKVTITDSIVEDDQGSELLKVETGTQTSPSLGGVATVASSSAKRRVALKDLVVWFKNRKPLHLSELHKDGKSSSSKFWKWSGREKRTYESPQPSPGSSNSQKTESSEQNLEDHQFLDLVKRDLEQIEAEINLCCQENAGLLGRLRQVMEGVIEEAIGTIKHGGDMDINEAIEYNGELLNMQQKYEILGCSLQKAKVDLASLRKICVRIRCRCWWCRGCSGLRKLILEYKHSLKIKGNNHPRRRKRKGHN